MGNATEITTENFDAEVIQSGTVALVDFGATWCGPCQALAPTIDELANDYADKEVVIAKCDVDQSQELAAKFGIMSVPTILFFKGGEQVGQLVGNQKKANLSAKLDALLGA